MIWGSTHGGSRAMPPKKEHMLAARCAAAPGRGAVRVPANDARQNLSLPLSLLGGLGRRCCRRWYRRAHMLLASRVTVAGVRARLERSVFVFLAVCITACGALCHARFLALPLPLSLPLLFSLSLLLRAEPIQAVLIRRPQHMIAGPGLGWQGLTCLAVLHPA